MNYKDYLAAAAIAAVGASVGTSAVAQSVKDFQHASAPTAAAVHLDVNTARLDQLMADPKYREGVRYTQEMLDLHMKYVGSIAGIASDTGEQPSPTTFSFTRDGKTVYVDYGLNSEAKTLHELERRVAAGVPFVDARWSNAAKLDPSSPMIWDPADYIKGIDYAPNHATFAAFQLGASEVRTVKLTPTMDALSKVSGPKL